MRTILASTLALAAMTSFALAAEAPKAPNSQPAGPVLLTDSQMGKIAAGQQGVQFCEFAFACVQNNQKNVFGDNIGGAGVIYF